MSESWVELPSRPPSPTTELDEPVQEEASPTPTTFKPHPNAFSRPDLHRKASLREARRFTDPSPSQTSGPTTPPRRTHSSSHPLAKVLHQNEALLTSLTTVLSCAEAASKRGPNYGSVRLFRETTPSGVGESDDEAIERGFGFDEGFVPTLKERLPESEPSVGEEEKKKRKRGKEKEKEKEGKVKRKRGFTRLVITCLGVVVLVSVIGFGTGYLFGRWQRGLI
ncbi:hypothetical protein K470DRAFT_277989 [Piedraia hortae CBS 480.64]|uniref:Uncharacterized protein n=1 Tax=Piedraia hortae CBS 480.64 TaxID=1314780 RepID=A0A6A7BVZ2_9PEZI|nr:hypothetical protein K470DRAFT_277989 [Piedraia hortae CBS 480.64]